MAATTSALFERLADGNGLTATRHLQNLQWCDAVREDGSRRPAPGVLAVYGLGLVWATRKHLAKNPGVWGPNDFVIATNTIVSVEVSPPRSSNYALGNLRTVRVQPEGGNWLHVTTSKGVTVRFSRLSEHAGMPVAFALDVLMASFGEVGALRRLVKHAAATRPRSRCELNEAADGTFSIELAAPDGYESVIEPREGQFRLVHRKLGSPNPHLRAKVGSWDDPAEQVWQQVEVLTKGDPVFVRVYRQGKI